MAAMSLLSSSACAKRAAKDFGRKSSGSELTISQPQERLPTISEDECQDLEHEANQVQNAMHVHLR